VSTFPQAHQLLTVLKMVKCLHKLFQILKKIVLNSSTLMQGMTVALRRDN